MKWPNSKFNEEREHSWAHEGEFSFLFLNLNALPTNVAPGQFGRIIELIKLVGIIAKKTTEREFSFSTYVLVAVVIVLLKLPTDQENTSRENELDLEFELAVSSSEPSSS